MPKPTRARLAALAAIFYGAHAVELLLRATPAHLLWSCNVASLLVAAAIALASPTWNAAAALLLLAGLPVWLLDLTTGGSFGSFLPTSLLTHLGSPALAVIAARSFGVPRRALPVAILTLAAATLAAALLSSTEENVNLARAIPPGWEWFPSHGAYLAFVGSALAAGMGVGALVLRALFHRAYSIK